MEIAAVWKLLSSYGVLGVMACVFMGVIAKLYRDREAERDQHRQELATLSERYRQELATLSERYQAKTDKYNEKIAALTMASYKIFESRERHSRDRRDSDVAHR
jgi:hypothetical protein